MKLFFHFVRHHYQQYMQDSQRIFGSTSISQSSKRFSFPFDWCFCLVYAAILLCSPLEFADNIKTSLLKKTNKCLGRPKLTTNTTSHVHIFVDGERHHNKNKRLCGTGKNCYIWKQTSGRHDVCPFCLSELHWAVWPPHPPQNVEQADYVGTE